MRTGYSAIADEWIGIRPGTDGLFVLALIHELLKADRIDLDYLARYTNAPWLVIQAPGAPVDGLFARGPDGEPLAFDSARRRLVNAKAADIRPAIVGEYELADGRVATPVFQLIEGDLGDLGGDAADERRVEAAGPGRRVGAVAFVEIALGDQLKDRRRDAPVGELVFADDGRADVRRLGVDEAPLRVVESEWFAVRPAREKPMIPARPAPGRRARARWCSGRDSRGRSGRPSAIHGSARGRKGRRFPA